MHITRKSQVATITNVATKFAQPMQKGQIYRLVSDVNCWFAIGTTTTAATRAIPDEPDACFLPAGQFFDLKAHDDAGAFVGIIRHPPGASEKTANLILLEV